MAAQLGLLGSEFFTMVVLPFLLVFVVVFAVLQKTKILGSAKKDLHAVVALVFGLMVVGVPQVVGVVLNIIPVVAVIIIILLSWMLTYGFVGGTKDGEVSPAWKVAFQVILSLVFLGLIAWSTGLYKLALGKAWANQIGSTLLLIGAIAAVISIVVSGKDK